MTETEKRGRGRPSIPPEEQRRRLFDAAERCFNRTGIESITVHDIVREAGMSSRSFYEQFEHKEQLAIELAIDRGDEFIRHLENVVSESETLLDAVDRSLAKFLDDPPLVILDLERMSGSVSTRAREVRDFYRAKIGEVLMRNIAAVAAAGLGAKRQVVRS